MRNHSTPWYALLVCSLFLTSLPLSAQTEIAIEDDEPAPTKATTTAPAQSAPAKTAAPSQADEQEEEGDIEVEEETEEKVEEKKAAPVEAVEEETSSEEDGSSNVGSMRPLYEAGIKAYRLKNYWRAITLLSKASETKDKATPKYYYAEAHAMMGVIFQFHLKNPTKACRQYQLALKIDPKTRTALKYRGKVCR